MRLRDLHPGIQVEVEDVLAADIDDSVRNGQVDFGVTASLEMDAATPAAAGDLRFEAMATDVFRLVTAPDHPLAGRDAVAWQSLASESFVSFDDASSVRSITDAVLATQGIVPVSRVTARNVATVAGLCSAGTGRLGGTGLRTAAHGIRWDRFDLPDRTGRPAPSRHPL